MANQHIVYNDLWWRQQRPSLLVVVGNGPVYNPATDIRPHRSVQFFANADVSVVQHTWQLVAGGAISYTIDISHNTYSKVFVPPDDFAQQYSGKPRLVTDFFSNADIFIGKDVTGWPETPEPPTFPLQYRGAFNTIQPLVGYNPAPDVWLLRPQAKFFAEDPVQWGPTPLYLRSALDLYQTYLDVPRNAQQAKIFSEYQIQWDFKQPITQNILFTIFAYNPATDVTRFAKQDKSQPDPDTFFRYEQRVGINAITFVPPTYNSATDVRFPRSVQFSDLIPEIFVRPQAPVTVVWNVAQLPPPTPPTAVGVVQNWQGRVVLSPKKIGESVFVPMDFISRLAVGETILSAIVACTVYSGTDPNPQNMIIGVAGVLGTVVEQEVGSGVLGTIYELLFTIKTSLGQTLELSGYFAVEPDLP